MSDPIHAYLGVKLAHLVAGFFGGLVRAIIHPKRSIYYAVGACTVGALSAGYLTPLVLPVATKWTTASVVSLSGSVGFLVGLCGLAVTEGIVKLARRWSDSPTIPKPP